MEQSPRMAEDTAALHQGHLHSPWAPCPCCLSWDGVWVEKWQRAKGIKGRLPDIPRSMQGASAGASMPLCAQLLGILRFLPVHFLILSFCLLHFLSFSSFLEVKSVLGVIVSMPPSNLSTLRRQLPDLASPDVTAQIASSVL